MNARCWNFLLFVNLAAAAATPALGQSAPAAGATSSPTQSPASIPDFSGIWAHYSFPGFEPPRSGPGPVVNKSRRRQLFDDNGLPFRGANVPLVSNNTQLVGDYTNSILKPQAAEAVKKHGEIELSGMPAPNPSNQCWPEPVPYIFWSRGIQMLQQPDQVTILHSFDHQVRHVRLNQSHPAQLTPSWYGDSVGHYEGDSLVIDTIGIKVGPFATVDHYGTPHTEALHVIERYRLIDYDAAKEALERDAEENFRFPPAGDDSGLGLDPTFKGKHLQLQLTVEDEGVFTTPWSATVTYRPASGEWPEFVCAENLRATYVGKDSAVPRANKPDF
jgi:hypothetical protein